jgi:hypothetical protein
VTDETILELSRRDITPELYRQIRELWKRQVYTYGALV